MAGIRKFNRFLNQRMLWISAIAGTVGYLGFQILLQDKGIWGLILFVVLSNALSLLLPSAPRAEVMNRYSVIISGQSIEGPVRRQSGDRLRWILKRPRRGVAKYRLIDLINSDRQYEAGRDHVIVLKDGRELVLSRWLVGKKEFDEIIAAISEGQRRLTA